MHVHTLRFPMNLVDIKSHALPGCVLLPSLLPQMWWEFDTGPSLLLHFGMTGAVHQYHGACSSGTLFCRAVGRLLALSQTPATSPPCHT